MAKGREGRLLLVKLFLFILFSLFIIIIIIIIIIFSSFTVHACILMLPPSFLGYRTILAIAGEDFSVIAADTRLSQGFSIHTRDSPKTYKL